MAAVCEVLAAEGYEPRAGAAGITLGNCPFAELAREHTELVCGMNLDLMRGLLDGLAEGSDSPAEGLADGDTSDAHEAPLRVRLDPAAGRCCVTLTPPA